MRLSQNSSLEVTSMYQKSLLYTKDFSKHFIQKLEFIFSLINLPEIRSEIRRRSPHPKHALLNALIYKNIRSIPSLLQLTYELQHFP